MAEVAIEKRFEIEVRDLEYQRLDGVTLLARLYRPIRPGNSGGSFPAVIDVHGGAWASGDRLNNAPLDEAIAKSGIVVLAIDFRMPPQHRYPASIADVNLAILVQGLADDNVTPDMADRFAAAYRARGGQLELHKFDAQPHTFIVRDPASDASRRATELIRDFVLKRAPGG